MKQVNLQDNKIADAVTKSNDDNIEKQEEITIPPEKREEILNKLRKLLLEWNTIKYLIIKRFNCIKICVKKWVKVSDLLSDQYTVNKNIRFKTSMLRSNLCDYSDAYIVVKGKITVNSSNDANKIIKNLTFKINAPFRLSISKISKTFIANAEDLDIANV